MFSRADFPAMARALAGIKGRFVLSLNDRPEVRQIFSAFRVISVPLTYTIHGGDGKDVQEVIIMDNKLPAPVNLPG